MSYKSFSYPIS